MCFYDENTVRTTCWETYHTCSDEELAKRTADRCKKQAETNAARKKYINNKQSIDARKNSLRHKV